MSTPLTLETIIKRLNPNDAGYAKTVEQYRTSLRNALLTKKRKRAERAAMVGNIEDSSLLAPIRWNIVKPWAGKWLHAIGVGKKLWESPTMRHSTQRVLLEFAVELKDPEYNEDIRGPLVSLMNTKLTGLRPSKAGKNVKKLFSDITAFRRSDFVRFFCLVMNSGYGTAAPEYTEEYLAAVRLAWGALNAATKANFSKAMGISATNPKIVQEAAKMFWVSAGKEVVETPRLNGNERNQVAPTKQDHQINPSVIDIGEIDALINQTNYDEYISAKLETLKKELEQMSALIGMPQVKSDIAKIVSSFIITGNISTFQNGTLQGPPGTGKTLFAVSIARIFATLGIVTNSKFSSLTRENFVQGFEGQTAIATNQVLLSLAFEGVIFIDEAPTLARGPYDSFGLEALQTIMRFITKYEGESVIIIAGYARALDSTFFSLDEGLARRFPRRMIFNGYSTTEMLQIGFFQFVQMTRNSSDNPNAPRLTKNALNRIAMWISTNLTTYKENDPLDLQISQSHSLFGNYGGDMRVFVSTIIESFSQRYFAQTPNTSDITAADVDAAGNDMIRKKKAEWSAHLQSLQADPAYSPTFSEPGLGITALVAQSVNSLNLEEVQNFVAASNSLNQAAVWYNGNEEDGGGTVFDEPRDIVDELDNVSTIRIRTSSSEASDVDESDPSDAQEPQPTEDDTDADDTYEPAKPRTPKRTPKKTPPATDRSTRSTRRK